MIRKLSSLLFILACAVCSARANIVAGPLTFGNTSPFAGGDFVPQSNVFVSMLPGVSLPSSPTGSSQNSASTFYFDLAPGWAITSISVVDNADFGVTDYSNFGLEYQQEVGLCTAANVCSTGSDGFYHDGGATLPALAALPQIGANQGFYYLSAYAVNTSALTDGTYGELVIHLTEVPEPGTMLLLSTGTFGIAFLLRSFRTTRSEGAR